MPRWTPTPTPPRPHPRFVENVHEHERCRVLERRRQAEQAALPKARRLYSATCVELPSPPPADGRGESPHVHALRVRSWKKLPASSCYQCSAVKSICCSVFAVAVATPTVTAATKPRPQKQQGRRLRQWVGGVVPFSHNRTSSDQTGSGQTCFSKWVNPGNV